MHSRNGAGKLATSGGVCAVLPQWEPTACCCPAQVSPDSADLGEPALQYTFAVGLASAFLLEAESRLEPHLEFAEWLSSERGALLSPEGLPPAASVERRARAFTDFFSRGDGARPPIAPRNMPAASFFSTAHAAEN